MGIGMRLKEAREAKKLTQKDLGELVGVTGSAITNYEAEKSHPKEQILYKLIEVLEVDANFLFQDCVPLRSISISPTEETHIKKYRVLDNHGQKTVDLVLDSEYDRCTQRAVPVPSPVPSQDSELRAAHNDNTEPDQLEKMKRDFERLEKLKKERESHKG